MRWSKCLFVKDNCPSFWHRPCIQLALPSVGYCSVQDEVGHNPQWHRELFVVDADNQSVTDIFLQNHSSHSVHRAIMAFVLPSESMHSHVAYSAFLWYEPLNLATFTVSLSSFSYPSKLNGLKIFMPST